MNKLCINGGNKLQGEVKISGAKNSALPILAASLLTADTVTIHNVPQLQDVSTMLKILEQCGANSTQEQYTVTLNSANIHHLEASYEIVKTMRAAILVLGPMLARFGQAKVSLPGGCAIGSRPIDQHIKGLQTMGAEIYIDNGYVYARANKLKGARIITNMVTVTGTENLMMAACLAEGETILENAAREPEVTDLANFLVAMGAKIHGIGTDCLVIQGVDRLHAAEYSVIPDRIETGTFLCAVAATGGDVILKNTVPHLIDAILEKLVETGATLTTQDNSIRIRMQKRPIPVSFRTTEYPGFPTDMQAQFMALNTIASGTSHVIETIFENRFMHVQELNRLGASINTEGHTAIIYGVDKLIGAPVMATDLRASASLIIAALAAEGQTTIDRIYHLDRGYQRIEEKLSAIGAFVERVADSAQPD